MTALWVHELAARFWANVGEEPSGFPRDLVDDVCWALTVRPEALPALSIDAVNGWLTDRGIGVRLSIPNRRLRACIMVHDGAGVLFVDADDPDDERRFSVAHEIAHYLVEYDDPRRQARARLGDGILSVLDGHRPATWDERLGAVLSSVHLVASVHLMERTPDGHLPGRAVSRAEQQADELAFELLVPFDAVRAALPDGADRAATEAVLQATFGLPPEPAHTYALQLAPEPPTVSLFTRLFSTA